MADFIKKVKRKSNFTTVNNDYLNDSGLSWKAKGLITYVMSLPDDWQLNISDLKNRSKDGRDATANGVKELIDNKYCFRVKKRSENGTFDGYNYFVSDMPLTNNPFSVENPNTDIPNTENPITENAELINTNNTKYSFITNTNSSNVPHENASLFPEIEKQEKENREKEKEEKSRKTLFKNSEVFKLVNNNDYSGFEKKFPGPEYEKIDLVYYFHSVNDWSDKSDTKRSAAGWLATVRTFIRSDMEKNKLKLKIEYQDQGKKINISDAMDFLNDME